MNPFRVLCLWLLMVALPLQGLAAASMQHCVGNSGRVAAVAAPASATMGGHLHAHAGHENAEHHAVSYSMSAASAFASDAHLPGGQADGAPESQTPGHKCAMCAFCGHAVALNQVPAPLEFGNPAHASPPEPSVLIPAIAALVPDKPPRA